MKKNFSKILVLVLSLALLIGAVVSIVASAENTPEIIGKNIQYGADLKFQIAVSADSVGGADKTVVVNFYEDATKAKLLDSAAAVYTDTSATNLGVDNAYVALSNYGISALAYNTEYYIEAVCDGKSTAVTYSAVEYFLERLYGDDVVNATTEKGVAQKIHYQNTLNYGSSAQTLAALNGKYDGKNVADYLYYSVDGKTGIGTKGDEVTLGAYTGSEANFTRWIVTDMATSTKLATLKAGDKFTLNANTVVAPYFGYRGTGLYYDQANSFDNTTATALKEAGQIKDIKDTVDFSYDAVQNDYALVTTKDGDAALEFGSVYKYTSSLYWKNSNKEINDGLDGVNNTTTWNDSYVFETDIYFDNVSAPSGDGYYFEIYLTLVETKFSDMKYAIRLLKGSDGGYYLAQPASLEKMADIKFDEWYNLRVEVNNHSESAKTTVAVYLNGEEVFAETALPSQAHSYPLESVVMRYSWNEAAGKIYLDNTYFSNVYEVEGADDYRGTGLYADKAENFDDISEHYVDRSEANIFSSVGLANDNALKAIGSNEDNSLVIDKKGDGTGLVLEYDLFIDKAVTTRSNKALFGIYGTRNETAIYNGYCYSFSCNLNDDGTVLYTMGASNNPYTINLECGKWYNIRYEIDEVTPGAESRFYINGELVHTDTQKGGGGAGIWELTGVDIYNYGWNNTGMVYYLDNLYFGTK